MSKYDIAGITPASGKKQYAIIDENGVLVGWAHTRRAARKAREFLR